MAKAKIKYETDKQLTIEETKIMIDKVFARMNSLTEEEGGDPDE